MDNKANNGVFKQYYNRLMKEGLLKSFLASSVISFSLLFVATAIGWYFAFNQVWIMAICFVLLFGGTMSAFYFLKFKPTAKKIAQRVDALGLEERIITMMELENDDSFIALRQREDAYYALEKTSPKAIKFVIVTGLIVATSIVGFFGVSMTTVYSLAAAGVIPNGKTFFEDVVFPKDPEIYTVKYGVEGNGTLVNADNEIVEGGVLEYTITEGEDAPRVTALPEMEFVFVKWSDGLETPYRHDIALTGNIDVKAIFEALDEPEEEEQDGNDRDEGNESDEGQPSDNEDGKQDSNDSDEDNNGNQGNTPYEANNQVYDGQTYYGGPVYENAYADAVERLSGDENIPEELKQYANDYYETIKK